jgi:hypothetical protein
MALILGAMSLSLSSRITHYNIVVQMEEIVTRNFEGYVIYYIIVCSCNVLGAFLLLQTQEWQDVNAIKQLSQKQ